MAHFQDRSSFLARQLSVETKDRKERQRIALQIIGRLFDHNNFLTFKAIQKYTGLQIGELVQLKPDLEAYLQRQITSRVDLLKPGFFLED
jgi:hypothetical protein